MSRFLTPSLSPTRHHPSIYNHPCVRLSSHLPVGQLSVSPGALGNPDWRRRNRPSLLVASECRNSTGRTAGRLSTSTLLLVLAAREAEARSPQRDVARGGDTPHVQAETCEEPVCAECHVQTGFGPWSCPRVGRAKGGRGSASLCPGHTPWGQPEPPPAQPCTLAVRWSQVALCFIRVLLLGILFLFS